MKLLFPYLKPYRKSVVIAILFMLFDVICEILQPILMSNIVGADNAGTDKALVFTTADGTALGKSENIQAANSRIRDTDMADDGIRQGQRGYPVCTGDARSGESAAPERAPAPPVRIVVSIFLCLFFKTAGR